MPSPPIVPSLLELSTLLLLTARFVPLVVLVPVLSLRGASSAFRLGIALILAASVLPTLPSIAAVLPGAASSSLEIAATPGALPVLTLDAIVRELFVGLPVALGAALPLWTLSMVGGTVDTVLAASPFGPSGTVPRAFSNLFDLLAGLFFLGAGGVSRAAAALASLPPLASDLELPVRAAATAVSAGISVAVMLALPLIAVAFVVDVALAMVSRSSWPVALTGAITATRAPVLVIAVSLLIERML